MGNSLILPSPESVNGVANFQVPSIDLGKCSQNKHKFPSHHIASEIFFLIKFTGKYSGSPDYSSARGDFYEVEHQI